MRPIDFRAITEACGLNQTQAAALFGVTDRTVRLWIAGKAPVPPAVAIILRLLNERKITIADIQNISL